jgi:hypothetical protein
MIHSAAPLGGYSHTSSKTFWNYGFRKVRPCRCLPTKHSWLTSCCVEQRRRGDAEPVPGTPQLLRVTRFLRHAHCLRQTCCMMRLTHRPNAYPLLPSQSSQETEQPRHQSSRSIVYFVLLIYLLSARPRVVQESSCGPRAVVTCSSGVPHAMIERSVYVRLLLVMW